jgi:hypothetical protein
MPFAPAPKSRISATARGCRAVVAARLANPGSEWRVFRALQLANFTTPLVLEDDEQLREVLDGLPGIDGAAIIAALDSPEVTEVYERDKAQTRAAAGSAAELQGKTATTDGPVRFTAPSVVFAANGTKLVAGGFQPVEAYDVLIANLDPTLRRQPPPEDPAPLLAHFGDASHDSRGSSASDPRQRRAGPGRGRGGADRTGGRGARAADAARRRRAVACRPRRIGSAGIAPVGAWPQNPRITARSAPATRRARISRMGCRTGAHRRA